MEKKTQPDAEEDSLQAEALCKFCSDQTSRVLQSLFTDTPTHLPTVRFCNKAFGSSSYLVINVERPLYIIDIGCDDVSFFSFFLHMHIQKAGAPG